MIERTLTGILACITLIILIIIYYYHYHKGYSFLEIAKYPIKKYKEQKKGKEERKEQIRSAFKLAEDYLHRELDNKYLNQSKYIEINYKAIKVKESYGPLANKVLSEFPLFYSLIKNENFKEEHNQEFIKNEKERCKLEYGSLTDAQKTAIFTDEDAVLEFFIMNYADQVCGTYNYLLVGYDEVNKTIKQYFFERYNESKYYNPWVSLIDGSQNEFSGGILKQQYYGGSAHWGPCDEYWEYKYRKAGEYNYFDVQNYKKGKCEYDY